MSSEKTDDGPLTYAIRYTVRARFELIEAALRLGEIAGPDIAEKWGDGFTMEIARLATKPRQFPIISEQRYFKRETRHLVYRRNGSSVYYRALYVIEDEGDNGPTVTIIHFRHASSRPLGRKAAREIEATKE